MMVQGLNEHRVSSFELMSLHSGPILPSQATLNEFEEGSFVLTNLAAKRAKQLKDGAAPLVRIDSNHPLTIALAEIAAGKIRPILGGEDPVHVEVGELPILSDEPLPVEKGLLLPALDESEADLIAKIETEDEGIEPEEEAGADTSSLSDLLDEGEATPEVVVAETPENEISLSDVAEQEMLDEEESDE